MISSIFRSVGIGTNVNLPMYLTRLLKWFRIKSVNYLCLDWSVILFVSLTGRGTKFERPCVKMWVFKSCTCAKTYLQATPVLFGPFFSRNEDGTRLSKGRGFEISVQHLPPWAFNYRELLKSCKVYRNAKAFSRRQDGGIKINNVPPLWVETRVIALVWI